MVNFSIVELEDGLTVVELEPGQSPEDVAATRRGVLVDPGPYPSYDEACDALLALQDDEEEERA